MRSPIDDADPQQTLPPRRQTQGLEESSDPSSFQTRGRRLKLGTLTKSTGPAGGATEPAIDTPVVRGFSLGREGAQTDSAVTQQAGVQRWIWWMAGGAIGLLALAFLLVPSSQSSADTVANKRLLQQYMQYLETKGGPEKVDVAERKKEVTKRLQAIEWAKSVDDRAALENELESLLFLDRDMNSPLYRYSVAQLKQLGPPRKSSL